MTLQLNIKRSLTGVIAIAMLFSLAACRNSSQSGATSGSSSTSSSEQSNQKRAATLLKKAQKQIENGQTTSALTTLKKAQELDSSNDKVSKLLANVQNYLDAKDALNDGDTSSANESLAKMTSEQTNGDALTSQAKDLSTKAAQLKEANRWYQNAYDAVSNGYYETAKADLAKLNALPSSVRGIKNLQNQGKSLTSQINAASSSTTTAQSSNSSSSSTSSSTTSQTTGGLTDEQTDQVITSFTGTVGITNQSGLSFGVTQLGTNYYQVEVRQNNSSNTVGSLTGIYRYNTQTGSYTKLNTITGKYEK
ncbi:hypothetical protein NR458_02860 [Pediococcus ethanolidurans]|uniref:hypothetical protein n=1 Tax=Pediococcus ethanolidurans TaxID=319653 RepID=UPI001C1F1614|nr:hypothetical protein [Pediococcus ethanolidurans]MBU7554596.1 hypothetical protein [Pediococcus ethanolidurans]MCT4398630.1 hypothetical protein [Pediococcus ethanolidurans]MCV3323240.1 hypothetical protein [Pediococcus ethanolidurans]MCV3554893.1 hypothetical protein [Pediococcus ethanolidurans]